MAFHCLRGAGMKQKFFAVFVVTFLLIAVSASYWQNEGSGATPEVWGGRDISMVVSGENVTIEFSCAQGIILTTIKPDANGDFSVAGTYTPQRGGPVMKNNPPSDLPATYKGKIQGNSMHLQVLLQNKDQQPPAFTLTKGEAGRVVKCR